MPNYLNFRGWHRLAPQQMRQLKGGIDCCGGGGGDDPDPGGTTASTATATQQSSSEQTLPTARTHQGG